MAAERDWDTYDRAAATYGLVRPTYPMEVFDQIELYAGGRDRIVDVVEIGIGAGQATMQLASRGWHVLGLEPGSQLAATARQAVGSLLNVVVQESTFEAADLEDSSCDLVAAADRADYDPAAEIEASSRFSAVERHVTPFSVDYATEDFLALIDTYASHRHLDTERRQRLHDRLRGAIDHELDGVVTKPYEAVLVLARLGPNAPSST